MWCCSIASGKTEKYRDRALIGCKREHDVADILALLEEHPEIRSAELVARVQDVRRRLLSAGLDGSVSG